MRRSMYICTFLASGVATAAALSASPAIADYSNKHAVACMAFGGTPTSINNVVQNASGASELTLLCDAPDDTSIPGNTITTVHQSSAGSGHRMWSPK